MNVLAFEELYAGKLCAALDRQHPRDLFDVNKIFTTLNCQLPITGKLTTNCKE